ncbi:MAG: glycosyl transferase family 1 [Flavobacteriaceae bacterium]|nr:glycosyl transferase family 1 [Flavobacteriaceae bacterium]|tara:strand:+ start:23105 stop:24172 length:1068 start_codon:yes stop_codon:yes gene_type:complete
MKRIFLESHNLKNPYSGFGQYNYHLIKGLAAQDLSDWKITLHVKNVKRWKKEFGDTFRYRKYRSLTRHKPFRIKKKYHLWHSLNQNIKIEPFFQLPYVLTVHDIHFIKEGSAHVQRKLRTQFEKKLKRCHAIIYISEFAKQDTQDNFDIPDIPQYVIYNGNTIPDVTVASLPKPSIQPESPYLFSIGDFTDRKNFKALVDMMRFLPEYHLVLAGNNTSVYADSLRKRITDHQLENRVHLTGKISEAHKYYYLAHCEAFLFPSKREGFGIPPLEAMHFGKPVFISNNTSLPEIGGEHAFYWNHFEVQYMVAVFKKGMQQYQENKEFYTEYYQERAKEFDWKKTAAEYLAVYQQLVS